jgi:hypothetical protein
MNLKGAFSAAWESEERRAVQEDIRRGLAEVNKSLGSLLNDVGETPAAQQLREDIVDFSSRVREGEVSQKLRGEITTVLQRLNQELEDWSARTSHTAAEGGEGANDAGAEQEESA